MICFWVPDIGHATPDVTSAKIDEVVSYKCQRGYKWADNSTEKIRKITCTSFGIDEAGFNETTVPPNCTGMTRSYYMHNHVSKIYNCSC